MQEIYDDMMVIGRIILDDPADGFQDGEIIIRSDAGKLTANGIEILTTNSVIEYSNFSVKSVSSDYTLTSNDGIVLVNSDQLVTITLAAASPALSKKIFNIKRIGNGIVRIVSLGGTIDGETMFSITAKYSSVSFCTDGSNWFII